MKTVSLAPGRAHGAGPTDLRSRLPDDHKRPQTRGECPDERPCPFVGCRHHLAIDVRRKTIHADRRFLEWLEGNGEPPEHTCSLDLADDPHSLEEIGQVFGMSRERVRQIESGALIRLRKKIDRGELEDVPDLVPSRALRYFGDLEGWEE